MHKIRIHTSYNEANGMTNAFKYRHFIRIIYERNSLPDHVKVGR